MGRLYWADSLVSKNESRKSLWGRRWKRKKELAQTGRQKARVGVRVGDRPKCLDYTGKNFWGRRSPAPGGRETWRSSSLWYVKYTPKLLPCIFSKNQHFV